MRKSVMSLFATVGMVLLLAGCSDVIGNTSYESATVASSTMARTVVADTDYQKDVIYFLFVDRFFV